MISLLSFLQGLGQLLLHSFWLMGICWLLAIAIIYLLKDKSARIKQQAVLIVLFGGLVTTGYLALHLFSSTQNTTISIFKWQLQDGLVAGKTLNDWLQLISFLFAGFYLLGMLRQVLVFANQLRVVRAHSKLESDKVPIHLKLFLEEQRHLLGIKRGISIIIKDHISSACTIGFWKPIVLMPAAALVQLSPTQLEAILLHELSHIKKLDFVVNWILVVIEQLFFFNPFVQKLTALIKEYREQSSDELVLQFKYSPLVYAEALLILAKNEQRVSPLLVSATDGMLKRRIEKMLLAKNPGIKVPFVQVVSILAIALVLTVSIESIPTAPPVYTSIDENKVSQNNTIQIIPVSYNRNVEKRRNKAEKIALKPTRKLEAVALSEVAFENAPGEIFFASNEEPARAYSLGNIEAEKESAANLEVDKLQPYLPKNSFEYKLSSDNLNGSANSDVFKENLINEMISEINQLKSIQLIEKESGSDFSAEKERSTKSIKAKIEEFNKIYPNQLGSVISIDQLNKQLAGLKYKSKALELKSKKDNLVAEYKYIIEISSDSAGKKTVVF